MIELSIEEKAKRYDEAIKLVNTKWYYKNQPCFINVSELFPEFKENKDENIKKWLIEYFQEFKSTDIEGFANGLKIDNIVAWLEKQNNTYKVNQQTIDIPFGAKDSELQEATYYIPDGYHAEINGNEVIIKKDEQKSVDVVEPKFKVGDFIANDYCRGKVVELTNDAYLLDTGQGIPFSCEHNIHLWTIEDAKDGDVLVASDDSIFIYKCQINNLVVHYIALTHCNSLIINENNYGWENKNACHPATKEQRDLLFQKMKEKGYDWNVDKKIPTKVTTMSKTQTSEYCYILNYNTGEVFKHHITEDEVNLTTEELLKKYGFKETECHIMYSSNNLELKLLEN